MRSESPSRRREEAALQTLLDDHTPEAIQRRLSDGAQPDYLRDSVFGAIDGTVTTFAVAAGATGAQLDAGVVLVLGLANLLADGLSMAVGNFTAVRSEVQRVVQIRRVEHQHIELVPDGEREEIRQIFAGKGFDGADLERVVELITADRDRWVETMLREEHGLAAAPVDASRAAAFTFAAFVLVGALPLVPFAIAVAFASVAPTAVFWSGALTGFAFLATGWWKARAVGEPRPRSALETLALGGTAAAVAYAVGFLLRGLA
jgi:VIT1/CCC1 family predicted Fe2+/Mn2+ transporter